MNYVELNSARFQEAFASAFSLFLFLTRVFTVQMVKNLPVMREAWVQSLGGEDPLKGMAAQSRILAWRIPWTEESMGWQRVGHH